ncbi:MAG: RNA polymerase subunit sigma, partial [Eubacteriales bacterium]|nr:RNA polymerase subunit sigma [Eubacteriales bacterium]
EEFNEQLSKWGISFDDLVRSSPGQDRTKEMCSRILRFLLGSHELIRNIKTKKTLPVSTIEKFLGISPKKMEKHRKYIIAALLIYTGNYPYLRKYIVIGKDKRGGQK